MNIRKVTSNQIDIHKDLGSLVVKYKQSKFKKPILGHTLTIFEKIRLSLSTPWILDSGCGVGESTIHLALRHPQHFILGIDKSEFRLKKNVHYYNELWPKGRKKNYALLRADLVSFWHCLWQHQILPEKHYILYPNPWPKASQLKRRWHAHPVFPLLTKLSREVELRSNWDIYLKEFLFAWQALALPDGKVTQFHANSPITPFERKYSNDAQALYQLLLRRSFE